MTRVLSGAVMLVLAIAIVWFAPAFIFLIAAEALALLAFYEYVALARASGLHIPALAGAVATALTALAFAQPSGAFIPPPLDVVLLSAFIVLGALALPRWAEGRDALALAASSALPLLYIGLPIGAMIAIREARGREALSLLMLTVVVSDTAQYYSGRTMGKRLLAPVISPKKTVEGALGGFVGGAVAMAVLGAWWMPEMPVALRALVGATLVALGISGDLFESMLKRSAGVKDSSTLIPGHGGVLDRIDALLFCAPLYYIVVKYLQ